MAVIFPISTETLFRMGFTSSADTANTNDKCLVFRTSLTGRAEVRAIAPAMDAHPGIKEWSVDLEDWENVLRVLCESYVRSGEIIKILAEEGIFAKELPV